MNYFDRPEVSNSDLKLLKRYYYGLGDLEDFVQALKFGSLVDAMLTESHRIDARRNSLLDERGNVIIYDLDQWHLAQSLADNAARDPVIKIMIKHAQSQHIFVRRLDIVHDMETVTLRARCKFDTIIRKFSTGLDYKTTAASTYKQFKEAIEFFDWDQQGAFYMDLARIDRHWIAGISKKTGEIFKVPIARGDPIYQRGLDKYSYWGYKWFTLVENFTLPI